MRAGWDRSGVFSTEVFHAVPSSDIIQTPTNRSKPSAAQRCAASPDTLSFGSAAAFQRELSGTAETLFVSSAEKSVCVSADTGAFLLGGINALLSTAIAACAQGLLVAGESGALGAPTARPSGGGGGGRPQSGHTAPLSCLMDWAESFPPSRSRFQKCFLRCDGLCSTLSLFKRGCTSSGVSQLLMD